MTANGSAADLAGAADALYALVPADFTAARDASSAEARRQGDRPTADAIKALKRPSAPAWAVNILARERTEDLQRLLGLGASLREAQARLSADDMRELSRQRHGVIAGLTRKARDLAASRGQPVSDTAARQIEQTLGAALADEAAAAAVASGRLVRALEHSGIGGVDLDGAVGGPMPGPIHSGSRPAAPAKPSKPAKSGQAIEAARGRLDAARKAAERARDTLEAAEAAVREAGDRQSRADEAARRIERDLVAARKESESAQRALDGAARSYTKAEEAAEAAEARAAEAESRLANLEADTAG